MPPDRIDHDVVIVGAGPSGCAAAIALRRSAPELNAVLIDAGSTLRYPGGEVLPAAGVAMLRQLGVMEAVAAACRPAPALASCWGGAGVRERQAVFSASGPDWHLDRNRFDELLIGAAMSAGAIVRRGAAVAKAEAMNSSGDGWRFQLATGETLTSRMVIWATGRRRGFLRAAKARATAYDRLAGYVRRFSTAAGDDPRTLLEATEDGWWYAALDPSGFRVVAFMTDADLGRSLGAVKPERWNALLEKCDLVRGSGEDTISPVEVRAAHSSLIDPVCGTNWVAVGDAACCFEPLASRGIAAALRSGCFAAYIGRDMLAGREGVSCIRYAAVIKREFEDYRQGLVTRYALERRWPERIFWTRRTGLSS